MLPPEGQAGPSWLGAMRTQWNEIATRNAFYGVVSWPEFETLDQVDQEKFWTTGRESVDRFLDRLSLGDTRTQVMVEIGCGLGRMTHRFAERFGRVYAVDVSPEMIKRASAQWAGLPNVTFILGSGNDLPGIADGSIDFVFSYIVLQHVPHPQIVKDYLRETARVLKPGGLAHLQFRTEVERPPKPESPKPESMTFRALRALANPRRALGTAIRRLRVPGVPWRDYSPPVLRTLAHEFGRFESWRGCALSAEEAAAYMASRGLSIEQVTGLGTQYTFYTLRMGRDRGRSLGDRFE